MKSYFFCLVFLLYPSTQTMYKVTASLPQESGEPQIVEFDIDSNIFAQEICRIYQIPYSEPTAENIQSAQDAHRDTCRALNRVYIPLAEAEAKALYNQKLGELMLEAVKEHRPRSYPLIIGLLAAKTSTNQSYSACGS